MGWFDEQIKQRIENDDALFTEGFSATAFATDRACTRAQIVTFLYRSMA